jgi:hypothetical protein
MILGTVGYHYHLFSITYYSLYQVRKNKLAAMIYSSVLSTVSPNDFLTLRINTTGNRYHDMYATQVCWTAGWWSKSKSLFSEPARSKGPATCESVSVLLCVIAKMFCSTKQSLINLMLFLENYKIDVSNMLWRVVSHDMYATQV